MGRMMRRLSRALLDAEGVHSNSDLFEYLYMHFEQSYFPVPYTSDISRQGVVFHITSRATIDMFC